MKTEHEKMKEAVRDFAEGCINFTPIRDVLAYMDRLREENERLKESWAGDTHGLALDKLDLEEENAKLRKVVEATRLLVEAAANEDWETAHAQLPIIEKALRELDEADDE